MNPASWFLLASGSGSPAYNMALDECLLMAAPQTGRPVLRFYGWAQPAASFGYSQPIALIERLTPLRPLVRRPTGGGLVPHDTDWTYSVAVPPAHPWYALKAVESYARIHQWLQSAFARLGVPTELAPSRREEQPGQCFFGHETSDLLWRHRKIAGAAQRRTKTGLLIQGSVQPPPPGLARSDWELAMSDVASADWGIRWETLPPSASLMQQAQELADHKYALPAYNRRR